MDYRSAGVNIKAGESLVQWLKQQAMTSPHVVSGIGGFSGLFQLVFPGMKEPCLSASTDGVGTKIKLAVRFNRYKEIGQDLVAMCVNDVICSGARPLFFMDYYACGKLNPPPAKAFLTGVQKACEKSHCVLLGGETAEMPDCYREGDFDCAGFALGVVDKAQILGAHKVQVGDRLVGVSSSGFHSNGFSLLRKVFQKDLDQWEKELIKPTALYADLALELFKLKGDGLSVLCEDKQNKNGFARDMRGRFCLQGSNQSSLKAHKKAESKKREEDQTKGGLKALAHITGGGLDNVLRVLPKGMGVRIKPWEIPVAFREVQKRAGLSDKELMKTLNCGVGLVVVTAPSWFDKVQALIQAKGFKAMDLGEVVVQKESPPSWFLADGTMLV